MLEELQRVRTEEDVKDAYIKAIKALGLKGVFKGLVDIQTPEIWFEAMETTNPPLPMALSPEAQAVLDEGRNLFQRFHATSFPNKIRQE